MDESMAEQPPFVSGWKWFVTTIRDHLGIDLSEDASKKIRGAFLDVGSRNYEDFASSVVLEALTTRAEKGLINETEVIQAAWRVAKRICREASEAISIDPSALNTLRDAKTAREASSPSSTAEAQSLLEFAQTLDALGGALLAMRLQGLTLSEIADKAGLSTTTVWERLHRLKLQLRGRLGSGDSEA